MSKRVYVVQIRAGGSLVEYFVWADTRGQAIKSAVAEAGHIEASVATQGQIVRFMGTRGKIIGHPDVPVAPVAQRDIEDPEL